MYIIVNKINSLCWNNQDGWTDLNQATIFENKNFNLPLDGEWIEISSIERKSNGS